MKMTQGRPAIIAVTCILALGVVSGLCFAQDAPEGDPTGANLIYNGGFERLRDGAIDGWSGEGAASCEDAAHTGNRSMKLQPGA